MYKKGYLLMVTLCFTNCSTHLESTSMERVMDERFEMALVEELNKIRRVKGRDEISFQSSVESSKNIQNPFTAQMKRGY